MLKSMISLGLFLVSAGALAAPVTIEGKIAKIVPSKTEIYVTGKDDGKKNEFYFNKDTQVLKAGGPAKFEDLKVDQNVRVTADKKGKRLDPQKVEILE